MGARTILLVSDSDENRTTLRQILDDEGWDVRESGGITETRALLKPEWPRVILTESRLPDGTWVDLLALATAVCPRAKVIVTAPHADEWLWAEVLNHGAFDLLNQPLDADEVLRVGTSALRIPNSLSREASA